MTLNAIKNTLFTGNVWYHFEDLHSTNDLAAEWLSRSTGKGQNASDKTDSSFIIHHSSLPKITEIGRAHV